MRLIAAILILPASVAAILWFAVTQFGGTNPSDNQPAASDELGRHVYMTRCISCHQANGVGIRGYFPPLDGTDWVQDHEGRLIRILLHGMTGPTIIQGVEYNGAMPAWGTVLSDEEIASVLTYIRSSWGNEAQPVAAADVAAVRSATQERRAPWTHDELTADKNIFIPESETGK